MRKVSMLLVLTMVLALGAVSVHAASIIIEGEDLDVVYIDDGLVEMQEMGFFTMRGFREWSGDHHLWWRDGWIGDELEADFDFPESGTYEVFGVFTVARDYAQVQLYLNGEPIGEVLDLYDPEVRPTEPISLGVVTLTEGVSALIVEIVGNNEMSVDYMFGLDYLEFVPVED